MSNQTPYTYIFIREDLEPAYRTVQTGHALYELALRLPDEKKPKKTSHFVLLRAKSQAELIKQAERLEQHGIDFHMFHEPDIGEFTSIATEPIYSEDRKIFKRYSLLR